MIIKRGKSALKHGKCPLFKFTIFIQRSFYYNYKSKWFGRALQPCRSFQFLEKNGRIIWSKYFKKPIIVLCPFTFAFLYIYCKYFWHYKILTIKNMVSHYYPRWISKIVDFSLWSKLFYAFLWIYSEDESRLFWHKTPHTENSKIVKYVCIFFVGKC